VGRPGHDKAAHMAVGGDNHPEEHKYGGHEQDRRSYLER
jgi:hypothetical protein